MARERERYVKRTGRQPSAGELAPLAPLDIPLAKTPTAAHPALITLVKLLARQAAHGALARHLARDTDDDF